MSFPFNTFKEKKRDLVLRLLNSENSDWIDMNFITNKNFLNSLPNYFKEVDIFNILNVKISN